MKYQKTHDLITTYFKTGCLKKTDRIYQLINFRLPYIINAGRILKAYQLQAIQQGERTKHFSISSCNQINEAASEMQQFIQSKLNDVILSAYLHGSLGTNELINYSDFDGIVILNHQTFATTKSLYRTAILLKQSELIMKKMDPLQHHGWFIATDKDLTNFPVSYFPPALFKHCCCIHGDSELTVSYAPPSKDEAVNNFKKHCRHLLSNLNNENYLTNYYDLKSLLSGFMLLPSFYLQIKNTEGVFKKDSFELLRQQLSVKEYEVMDVVSELRQHWRYHPSALLRLLLRINNHTLNYFFWKKYSGKLTPQLKAKMLDLKPGMKVFIETLLKRCDHEI
jgi:hypothetical protein